MKKLLFWLLIVLSSDALAQTDAVYLVHFTEKPSQTFDPSAYFDAHTLARRARLGLPASDWYDLPVSEAYVAQVAEKVVGIRHTLRWFNAVSVRATPSQIQDVATLPFVQDIERLEANAVLAAVSHQTAPPEGYDTLLMTQRLMLEFDALQQANLTGKGVRIAILDAGFKEADTHPSLSHLRESGRIIHTYDFYGEDSSVYHHDRHGMEVLSCIAGTYEDQFIGAAPDAEFLLARVEHAWWEPSREEDHWLAAAEWADRHGADLINSSLGYTNKRYEYADMDGKTAIVSRAAQIATQKGMLVINSAGNEGAGKWKYIGAPADVPEVLAVGGSLPMLPERIRFSSFGPNALGVIKPDVAAPGYVLSAWKRGAYSENAGTSFAAPLVTGMVACLLQRDSSLGPTELANRMRQAGHFYPYYDYGLGYGVVKGSRLIGDTADFVLPSFEAIARNDSIVLALSPYLMRDSAAFPFGRVLYYHLENEQGELDAFQTVRIPNRARFYFFRRQPGASGLLRIWFGGYYFETELGPLPSSESSE